MKASPWLGGQTGFNGGSLLLIILLVVAYLLLRVAVFDPEAVERRARRRAARGHRGGRP